MHVVVYFRSRHAVHPTTNIHRFRTRTYNVVSKRGRRIKEEEEEEEYETKKEVEGLEEQKEEVE